MKQVIAIIKPYLAEKVLDALKDVAVEDCDVCEVKGYGRQKNYLDEYRGVGLGLFAQHAYLYATRFAAFWHNGYYQPVAVLLK